MPLVTRNCEWCGVSFTDYPNNRERFCSKPCALSGTRRGTNNPGWKGGRYLDGNGYVRILLPDHPASYADGYALEHIVVVEAAIGKRLTAPHRVHHFNEVRSDNSNSNLVVCEDGPYHQLLHARQRVKEFGGDPNTQKVCCTCRKPKYFAEFQRNAKKPWGVQDRCRECCARIYKTQTKFRRAERRMVCQRAQ